MSGAESDAGAPAEPGNDGQDGDELLRAIPALLRELAASGVEELDVSAGAARLFIRQQPGSAVDPVAAPAAPAAGDDAGLLVVVTPLAGVFYASPSPEEPPYVQPGQSVEAGDVVGLVEAMKVFNEIRAERAGTIVEIVASPGQLVQAGEVLLRLRPLEAAPPSAPASHPA